MHKHFSRVKDCVLVAVQRRDAGRAAHETLFPKKCERSNPLGKAVLLPSRSSLSPNFLHAFALPAKAHGNRSLFYSSDIRMNQLFLPQLATRYFLLFYQKNHFGD